MRRHFEKGLAAKLDSKGCADCTFSIIFRSMASPSILMCINQTIYCLLVLPNPDSALNDQSAHLLQDDYDAFARQARLMTSIHARIPFEYLDGVNAAKRRGETAGTAIREDAEQRQTSNIRSTGSLSSTVIRNLPEGITSTQLATSNAHQTLEGLAGEVESDMSESKENHPSLSPPAVPAPSPRRASLAKRPLSDLRIVESEYDVDGRPCLSPSEQNVVNKVNPSAGSAASDSSWKGLQSAERSQSGNMTGRSVQETGANGVGSIGSEGRPTKRICSDSGKDNAFETWEDKKLIEKPLPEISAGTMVGVPVYKKAPTSSSLGTSSVKGKIRVGLRRL